MCFAERARDGPFLNTAKPHQPFLLPRDSSSLFCICFALVKKLVSGGYSIITHASVQLMGQELLEVAPRSWLRLGWRPIAPEASGKVSREPMHIVVRMETRTREEIGCRGKERMQCRGGDQSGTCSHVVRVWVMVAIR